MQIKVGDKVKSGDIIGYVEAMKVMNEITSDVDGEVVEIVAIVVQMLNMISTS